MQNNNSGEETTNMKPKYLSLIAAVLALSLTPLATAGTPLICFPFDIGNAQSLPWVHDKGIGSPQNTYDTKQLAADTINLLGQNVPVIVRMETLRRAALYIEKDASAGRQLLERLKERSAGGKTGRNALAVFDYGYFMETMNQLRRDRTYLSGAAGTREGYTLVREAIQLRGHDPEMEFAAAVITVWPKLPQHEEHLRNAVAGVPTDSLLADNLLSHFPSVSGTVADLRSGKTGSSKRR
jgi:hypothetical protein